MLIWCGFRFLSHCDTGLVARKSPDRLPVSCSVRFERVMSQSSPNSAGPHRALWRASERRASENWETKIVAPVLPADCDYPKRGRNADQEGRAVYWGHGQRLPGEETHIPFEELV